MEKEKGVVYISVPEKYREDRLRHWLNSVLARSAMVALVMYVLIMLFWRDTPRYLCAVPALYLLIRGLPAWISARQKSWRFAIDADGVRILSAKSQTRVNLGDAPSQVRWDREEIAAPETSTELGLPTLKLLGILPGGKLKHRLTLVYDPDDARSIQKDVLPLIEHYRTRSAAK